MGFFNNPGRFFEKKVGHEIFGFKDPKFPQNGGTCTVSGYNNSIGTGANIGAAAGATGGLMIGGPVGALKGATSGAAAGAVKSGLDYRATCAPKK
jgi:hypothetical protein